MTTIPGYVPPPRYRVHRAAPGVRLWAVWDSREHTWHDGQGWSAYYFAGVPCWKREAEATEACDQLNGMVPA